MTHATRATRPARPTTLPRVLGPIRPRPRWLELKLLALVAVALAIGSLSLGVTVNGKFALYDPEGLAIYVAALFAAHYHNGGALAITFTRLGGRRLDKSNLSVALKASEDAVCLMLGADDGDPRWQPTWEQEPGGAVGDPRLHPNGLRGDRVRPADADPARDRVARV